jgi:transcriptional regulator with XRE-family HTH domain|tara:strand:- start:2238 stop:2462 length:225 start_codon:yes stop_codon:yes gene_type:complete
LIKNRNNWSQILKDIREERNITQRELAYRAKMPQRTIAEYENVEASRQLSIYKIEQILNVLGYEVDVFLRDEDV